MSTFFGMLIISYPDKHQEHVRLLREVVHIGRDPDANDIPLPYPQVHEQHLALFCSQAGISVMNVSGADSTWIERPGLARARLAAGRDIVSLTNETAVVLADASAREESTIRLEVRLAPGVMEAPDPRPALEALIRLELKPDAIVLEAGERQALTLVVTSAASQVQNIILELDGIPPSWFTLPPPIGLIPTGTNERGAQETTTITLHPPLSDRSTANTYSLQLLARSDTYDGGVTRPLLLTVLPYISFDLSIQPEKMAGWPHGMFEVQLTSGSNFPLPLSLSVENAENALWPDVVPATADGMVRRRRRVRVYGPTAIQLDAGESRRYAVRIAPRRWHRRWRPFGRRRSYPFRLVARPNTSELALRPVAGSDEGIAKILGLVRDDHSSVAARAFVGELVHRPLPYWVLFLATLLLALATYLRFPQIPQTVADHIEQRRTFTVGYGPITQTITLEGIVMPAEAQRLAFGVNGRVSEVTVPEGGEVRTGRFISTGGPCESEPVNWIAVLEEEEALRQGCFTALRGLEKAESDLEQAQRQQERDQAQATQDLELAKQDLQRLSSGGEQDLYAAAEKNLIESARALTDTISTASAAKTEAENRMLNALNAQHEAEQRYSQAVWENQRVQETGRHPTEKEPNSQGGVETKYRKLNDLEKQQFRDAVVLAAQVLSDTQRLLQDATLAYDLARQQEVTLVQGAEARVAEAQKGVEALASGDNKDLNAARARADTAQRALDAIVERSLADQEKAIADAESLLKQAEQRWKESYLSPPSDGRVVALTIKPGDQAQAGTPVALIALTPLQFEVRAELSADQLQGLFTDQLSTVSVSLPSPSATAAFSVTARPISLAPAADLNVAAPGQTQSVIFSLDLPDDYDRQPLLENKPVKITVVRRLTSDDVCWVAPEAINVSPQGAYVMVRRGALDYRVPVRAGVRTDTQVAIQNIDPVPTATGDSAATAVPTPAIALPAPAPTPPPFCGQVQDLERQPEAGLGAWYTNLIRGQPTRQHELIVGP